MSEVYLFAQRLRFGNSLNREFVKNTSSCTVGLEVAATSAVASSSTPVTLTSFNIVFTTIKGSSTKTYSKTYTCGDTFRTGFSKTYEHEFSFMGLGISRGEKISSILANLIGYRTVNGTQRTINETVTVAYTPSNVYFVDEIYVTGAATNFSVARVEGNETTVQVSINTAFNTNRFSSCRLEVYSSSDESGTYTLAKTVTPLSNLLNFQLDGTYSAGEDYYFYCLQTTVDRLEGNITSKAVAPSMFCNIHMSGAANGGVAFGKISSATDENPLFENQYKTMFRYGGFTDSSNGVLAGRHTTYTIAVADWSASNEKRINITNLDADAIVVVSPDPSCIKTYSECFVYCSEQGAGYITMKAETKPSENITVNILALGGTNPYTIS